MSAHTHNIALMFSGGRAVATIVCYSDNPIDKNVLHMTVNRKVAEFAQMGFTGKAPRDVVEYITQGLRQEHTDVQFVIVPANAVMIVTKIPFRPNPNADWNSQS